MNNKKNLDKDPFPIVHVYHVTDTLVDAATVVVTDLCENLSNSINSDSNNIFKDLEKIDSKKFNSISLGNSMDGIYPVWVGVDKFNKVRKIFANINSGFFSSDRKKTKKLVSWKWDKRDLNDQFFLKSNKKIRRKKLFDMKINSSAIAIADYSGNFMYEHHDAVLEALNEKYFKIKNIYQNNYPIGLFIFSYQDPQVIKSTPATKVKEDQQNVVNTREFKPIKYIEFLSNLLDEDCYPTKYIFEKYLLEKIGYENKVEISIKDEKLSANYLLKRLPRALEILKKQNKILFGKNFKEVHDIRKNQFEDFIYGIVKDVEPQELNLPTFAKKNNKLEIKSNKLTIDIPGLYNIQDTFYDGYKLKTEPSLCESSTIPVKNGKYPCYIHSFSEKEDEDGYAHNHVYVVVEGIEGCYLNRNSKGQIFFDKSFRESLFLRENINQRSKKIAIDSVDLRNSETLKELEKISFVEDLELHGFKNIKNWNGFSKLKKLKKLKLISCDVNYLMAENFFKSLYSLSNLEELIIDDSCNICNFYKKTIFPKNLYFKKLKSFEIDFRKEWKNTTHKNFPNHKGYGDDELYFLMTGLPAIYHFPNFERFKSLEKLSIYNFFDSEQKEGTLFNDEYGFQDYYETINRLCKNSKIKDIWIYGYHFNNTNELANTRFLEAAFKITNDTNIKVNGINRSTLSTLIKVDALKKVKKNGWNLEYLNKSLKKDKSIVLEAVKSDGCALMFADESFRKDKFLVLKAIKSDGCALRYADESFRKDKFVVLEAIKSSGLALEFADERFKKDKSIVLKALKSNGYALKYADESFRKDKSFVFEAVKSNGYALKYADESFRKDKSFVLEAVKSNGCALQFADESFRKDKFPVLEAVKSSGFALEYADESLKKDKSVVLEAVKSNGEALKYADKRLKKDKSIVLEAVKSSGLALEFADERFKKDKSFVLEAVKSNGYALKYADERFKKDKSIVLEAVKSGGLALEFADESLKKDKSIVLQAVEVERFSLQFADESLQRDPDIIEAAKIK